MTEIWPRVTVVVVTHFSAAVIRPCLAAAAKAARVIVVDNASGDDTREIARATIPSATVIANTVGVGYGNAANQGLAEADTEFVLLLNPDAVLAPDCVPLLVAAADRWPDAGVLAPALRSPEGEWEVSHDVGLFARPALGPRTDSEPEGDICAEYVSGAVMLIRRSVYQQVGGFDPAIFLYYEDDDFCMRVRQAGHALVRVAAAVASHLGGGSIPPTPEKRREKFFAMAWSRLHIEAKWRGRASAWRIGLPLLIRHGLKAAGYAVIDPGGKGLRDAARFRGTLAWLSGRPSR
ncbi:glycosyltransferase family 2 protein [Elioraea rosea]|uniref:glycosyltransferase family 2 protein n=1 Tax=Elioraea rosea TaxID=2492390 RepID=UPI00118291BB|nr:glycosyltransferase family 2 protein [Elioraea rosea]